MSDILGYVSKTGHGTYYRETITPELAELEQGGRKMWTPLVSATDSAALRAELAKHQESEFHPDWSMLEATRDSLAEHQQIIRDQRERIRLLEDALASLRSAVKSRGLVSTVKALALADKALAAHAALGDKT